MASSKPLMSHLDLKLKAVGTVELEQPSWPDEDKAHQLQLPSTA